MTSPSPFLSSSHPSFPSPLSYSLSLSLPHAFAHEENRRRRSQPSQPPPKQRPRITAATELLEAQLRDSRRGDDRSTERSIKFTAAVTTRTFYLRRSCSSPVFGITADRTSPFLLAFWLAFSAIFIFTSLFCFTLSSFLLWAFSYILYPSSSFARTTPNSSKDYPCPHCFPYRPYSPHPSLIPINLQLVSPPPTHTTPPLPFSLIPLKKLTSALNFKRSSLSPPSSRHADGTPYCRPRERTCRRYDTQNWACTVAVSYAPIKMSARMTSPDQRERRGGVGRSGC